MTAVTYDLRNAAATAKAAAPAAPAKKGFWARVLDAMIESRMRQAEREIRMHGIAIPADWYTANGLRATYKDADKLPFVK
jgi:hypothetical protein